MILERLFVTDFFKRILKYFFYFITFSSGQFPGLGKSGGDKRVVNGQWLQVNFKISQNNFSQIY